MPARPGHVAVLLAVALALVLTWFLMPYKREYYTCLRCRMNKSVEIYFHCLPVTSLHPNECSEWFLQRNPGHEHVWRKAAVSRGRYATSKPVTNGVDHAVFHVEPELQKVFLSSCASNEANAWFTLLDSENPDDHQKAYDIAEAALQEYQKNRR